MQVVVGPMADQLAAEIRAALRLGGTTFDPATWLQALGGRNNVSRIEAAPGRVMVTVKDASRIDADALVDLGARAVGVPSTTSVHVLHADAEMLGARLAPG
jgi:PTS system N-acetylglucosamine-specific IIC component